MAVDEDSDLGILVNISGGPFRWMPPSDISMMVSKFLRPLNRCMIEITVVVGRVCRSKLFKTIWVFSSKCAVASSMRTILGFDRMSLHRQMICFSPNEKLAPPSAISASSPPTRVSQSPGKFKYSLKGDSEWWISLLTQSGFTDDIENFCIGDHTIDTEIFTHSSTEDEGTLSYDAKNWANCFELQFSEINGRINKNFARFNWMCS